MTTVPTQLNIQPKLTCTKRKKVYILQQNLPSLFQLPTSNFARSTAPSFSPLISHHLSPLLSVSLSPMGNTIAAVGKKKTAKVMKLDGTTFRVKPPAVAADVLRTHPGSGDLIESNEVKRMGIRARPLHPNEPLKPGKIYFLVEIPRLPDRRNPRRSASGALYVGARERLESLKLYRRSASDLTLDSEAGGALRVRMRLPRAQVAELMERSRDPGEAAEKIMELFVGTGVPPAVSPAAVTAASPAAATPSRREKRTRFVAMPDEIIA